MKRREMAKLLRKYGFMIERNNRHEVWVNGPMHIALPRGNGELNGKVVKKIKNQLRKGMNYESGRFHN